jgi:hypothetical protein
MLGSDVNSMLECSGRSADDDELSRTIVGLIVNKDA